MVVEGKKFELVSVGTGEILETVYAALMPHDIVDEIKEKHPDKEIYVRQVDKMKKIYRL